MLRRLIRWMLDPTDPPPPKPDATVEVAWLPLWQAQLVLNALWAADVPAVMSEDHTSHLRFAATEPMARIWVLGMRLQVARQIVADVIGDEPVPQHR